jgi:hypothetical protein
MNKESIVDSSRPNAGRIYDYYLGGHHNFEVDRQAAEQVIQMLPWITKGARLQRWSLQDIAIELAEKRKYDVIIDFASGLPTNDHIHHIVPEGTTVIYSDYDPVVVEYAREILTDTPNAHFFLADARRPEELLNRPEVLGILGDNRDVAFIYWGVSVFLTDDEILHAARKLYEWAGPNSCWAFNAQMANADPQEPALAQSLAIYKSMGSEAIIRPLAEYHRLVQPWKLEQTGFVSVLDWHGFSESDMGKEDAAAFGPGGAGYGAYLIK